MVNKTVELFTRKYESLGMKHEAALRQANADVHFGGPMLVDSRGVANANASSTHAWLDMLSRLDPVYLDGADFQWQLVALFEASVYLTSYTGRNLGMLAGHRIGQPEVDYSRVDDSYWLSQCSSFTCDLTELDAVKLLHTGEIHVLRDDVISSYLDLRDVPNREKAAKVASYIKNAVSR